VMAEVNRCDNCHEYAGCCLCYGNPDEPDPPRIADEIVDGLRKYADELRMVRLERMRHSDDGGRVPEDCLACGRCESCIDRSIAHAEEMETTSVPEWDGDYEE